MTDFQRWDYERDEDRLETLLQLKVDSERQSEAGADTTMRMIKLVQEIEAREAIIQLTKVASTSSTFLLKLKGTMHRFGSK
jgi:hypothetical protein